MKIFVLILAITACAFGGTTRSIEESRPATQACEHYMNVPADRIFGGEPVENGEFPWMALLGYLAKDGNKIHFMCGGTLISDQFVMTAAQCVQPSTHKLTFVRLGKITLNDSDYNISRSENYEIQEIIAHPQYSTSTAQNDIALIKLAKRIVFSDNLSPACLQTDTHDESVKTKLFVTGWGKTETSVNSQLSNILRKAELITMPLSQCNTTFIDLFQKTQSRSNRFRDGISESQYCAYDPHGQGDSCQGDSGGPLQVFRNADSPIATVVGITAFGLRCGTSFPGIYTRVAYYLDWIEQHVWPTTSR